MGSTCSTLDGVDAPRGGRASQIEQEQREKDAAALGEVPSIFFGVASMASGWCSHSSKTQDVGRARQAGALQAPRRAAREEPGARAAQEPAQNAQGREDLPRRPGLRQRGRPRRRGAPRGDPRGPVPPVVEGRLVRRLPGYVIIFLLLGVVQAPSTPTAGLLRVRERFIDRLVVPTRQKQARVRVHRGRELLGVEGQEERMC